MRLLIFGGAGFVGLNIADAALKAGHDVAVFDRSPVPDAALAVLAGRPGRLTQICGDVTDRDAVQAAVVPGLDAVVLGAAITADAARDAREPERILQVNLNAQVPIYEAAAKAKVGRIINLSSAAAYGAAGERVAILDEDTPCDPVGLYAITKWASERVGLRMASLWGLDLVNVRLSGLFGPWERATGVRDTLSPLCQILAAAQAGLPAVLPRPGLRDWTCSTDVADAVLLLAAAGSLRHRLYNITTGQTLSALEWGQALIRSHPGFVCRLAEPGEAATIDLHGPGDRAPLSAARLFDEFGWRCAVTGSAEALAAWSRAHAMTGNDRI